MSGVPPEPSGIATGEATVASNLWTVRGRHIAGWAAKIAEFGLVQGLVQLISAVSGLLIVRSLPKSEYAIFAIANSILVTCNALADLGIGIGIRSIGGRVCADPKRFGSLLKTALGLRYRFAVLSLGVCLPLAAWMLSRNGASLLLTAGLCLTIALSVIPLLGYAIWGTSAQLHGEYRRIQKLDLGNSLLRLGVIAALYSRLNSLLAFIAGAIANWVQMLVLRHWGQEKIDPNAMPNDDDRRTLIRLSVKTFPNTVFFCFQGQVTLLILTLVGNRTGVADITAIGRIAALFVVFSVVFQNLLGPRFVRCQDAARLPRLYVLLVGGATVVLSFMVVVAWLFPGAFLWLLGSKYAGLENECVWIIGAACVSQIGGIMWNLNSGKAWISLQTWLYIPIVILSQVVAALFLDLTKFHDLLVFNFVMCGAPLLIYCMDALSGLRRYGSKTL
jgi:hypothetical protein